MQIHPYLSFEGRAEEALNFYKKALGAKEGMVMRFKDAPPEAQANMKPGSGDKIMHMSFKIGDTELMGSDGYCTGTAKFEGISLTFNAKDAADAEKVFKALSDGGQVKMPIAKTFFSPAFGVVSDKLGVNWMIIVPQQM
ncbi:MAG TPA: VOC family protein [Dongiaceae bacterium]|jgi:PhnB protein|nr:VOC family protein [Dongiaceae bacterium]